MKWLFPRSDATAYEAAESRRSLVPADLALVVAFVAVALAVLLVWNPASAPIRGLVGLPLLFLAPGYALVSVLFPRSADAVARDERWSRGDSTRLRSTVMAPSRHLGGSNASRHARGLTDAERLALSFGASLAVLPFFGLLIATVDGFSPVTVIVTVSAFVLGCSLLAFVRRLRVAPGDRYRLDPGSRFEAVRSAVSPHRSFALAVVNVVLAVSVLLALGTAGYALLAPQSGEAYTGVQLLTEDDSGEYVAAGYPDAIEPGESVPLTVAVENQEGTSMTYTLVVQQQHVVDGSIVDRTEVDRLQYDLADGETGYGDRTITPTVEDGQVRLVFMLFPDGNVPEEPTTSDAYRYTHLWIDVGDGA